MTSETIRNPRNCFAVMRPALVSVGLFALAVVGHGESSAQAQSNQQHEDARACGSFGLSYGTRGYTACMQELQRRGNSGRQSELEEMAITSQIAKDGQIMAERARRQRCDRNPDRRECRRR
jgi:hypothetical protein